MGYYSSPELLFERVEKFLKVVSHRPCSGFVGSNPVALVHREEAAKLEVHAIEPGKCF